ncbi:hypothetical protein C9374_004376 [Naegleria lovaniensis]|uniref:Uncharacterized protein n=1 Tax=Naegleria lovaniensis TaxID=51637 RepID=A0AA88KLJ1_NAELO|nr:uncharacterized protein C9374_004376 [Naegleria lovaniensis]KAG2383705.1 hypothetical protein C9374_004376 [Naegleria lovaniensis]
MAESTQPLSSFPTSQRIVKGLARGLHYFTPYKFMLIGLFFLTMLVMTILSHFMAQASEEEEANSTLGNNNQETTTSASTTTSTTTLKITQYIYRYKKEKEENAIEYLSHIL